MRRDSAIDEAPPVGPRAAFGPIVTIGDNGVRNRLFNCLLLFWVTVGTVQAGNVEQLDHQALAELMKNGLVLVDVRTRAEWQASGVVDGSQLITFFDRNGAYDVPAFMKQLGAVAGPEDPVAFICATGSRTRTITHFLANDGGYTKVYNVTHGIRGWINAGGPVARLSINPD